MRIDEIVLGRYRALQLLGTGGQGEVWKARDEECDKIVCVKTIPQEISTNEHEFKKISRTFREIQVLAHPSIVEHIALVGEGEPTRHYLVMEFLDGCSRSVIISPWSFSTH